MSSIIKTKVRRPDIHNMAEELKSACDSLDALLSEKTEHLIDDTITNESIRELHAWWGD